MTLTYITRAMKLIWKSSPTSTLLNTLFVIIRGIMPLLMLYIIKQLIDTLITTANKSHYNEDLHSIIYSDFTLLLGGIAILFVFNSVSASLHTLVKEHQTYSLRQTIANIIHNKSERINYVHFEDPTFQDTFHRAVSESQNKPQQIFYNIIGAMQSTITLCAFGYILLSIHWLMPIMIVCIALPIVVLRIYFSRKFYAIRQQQTTEERRLKYYSRVMTAKEFAKELRLFGLSKIFKQKYNDTALSLHHTQEKLLIRSMIHEALTQLTISILMVVVFGFVIYQTLLGNITIGAIAMYFMALYRSYGMAQNLLQHIASIYDSNLYLKNLFEFIDMSVVDNPPQKQKESTTDNETNNIVFSLKECSFKYPNTERTVLNNISLNIHRGEIVSIVGCNGSGKSTLVKILCGLYEPTSGSIELNGKPMSQYSQQEISENITAIFQDFMLYNTSAHDNIWYGNLSENSDIERIQLAAQKSGIAPVFEKLKNGYDTALGNLFPNSEMLSQGEWQRTALARSFYSKARIIILDEPTSSLDAFTEASLIDNFRDITQGRTAIIISHRLSTIRMADRIIVLNNKKIAEIGTFDELMSQQGFLFSMVENLNK